MRHTPGDCGCEPPDGAPLDFAVEFRAVKGGFHAHITSYGTAPAMAVLMLRTLAADIEDDVLHQGVADQN